MQHRLHVGERDALGDHQAFDLVEHRRVRDVVIVAIHAARRDHRERRLAREHRADLHRRGVRAQQLAVREIEGVVHRARRMIVGDVERFEVVEVVFDLGTGLDFEAGLAEHLLDAQPHLRDRMQAAARLAASRQRDVDAFLRELRGDARLLELGALLLDALLDLFADAIEGAPASFARLGQLAEALSFSVSQPLLPSVRTRSSSSADRSVLDSTAPSVSARRASRSSGAPPLTSTCRFRRLCRERPLPALRSPQNLRAGLWRDRPASCGRCRCRPS